MSNRLIVAFLILISFTGFSQTSDLTASGKFRFELNTGLNFSKFHMNSKEFISGTKPFWGASLSQEIIKHLSLKGTINYSIKGSTLQETIKSVENHYLDLNIMPEYEFSQVIYLHSGLSYSYSLNSDRYDSELNILTGIALRVNENIKVGVNYTFRTKEVNTSNLQIGLNISLNKRAPKEPCYRRKVVEASKNQIKQLKGNVLLVRLKTSENTINAYRKAGEIDKADQVKQDQEIENKQIIRAFKEKFDFCPVRFFYCTNSNQVKHKQFKNIFLNDDLLVDNSIGLDTNSTFLVAEFGYIEPDTLEIYAYGAHESVENGGIEKVKYYYSPSTDFRFYALRILDSNFVQLNRPFPYYVRAIYKSLMMQPEEFIFLPPALLALLPWTYNETVRRMNQKLERYYNKYPGKL